VLLSELCEGVLLRFGRPYVLALSPPVQTRARRKACTTPMASLCSRVIRQSGAQQQSNKQLANAHRVSLHRGPPESLGVRNLLILEAPALDLVDPLLPAHARSPSYSRTSFSGVENLWHSSACLQQFPGQFIYYGSLNQQ
jgi:hypothetical protein